MGKRKEIAVFGGGCFWCTEAIFEKLKGVISVMPGYAGGWAKSPKYEEVCSGQTGHAEVVKIEFDPTQIKYKDLLVVFFATHDPTTLNQQGNDVGPQYRSTILYLNEIQRKEAESLIKELNDSLAPEEKQVVTKVQELNHFYEAEDHHKNYYRKNPSQPYCQVVIAPKVIKLEKQFSGLLKTHLKDEKVE